MKQFLVTVVLLVCSLLPMRGKADGNEEYIDIVLALDQSGSMVNNSWADSQHDILVDFFNNFIPGCEVRVHFSYVAWGIVALNPVQALVNSPEEGRGFAAQIDFLLTVNLRGTFHHVGLMKAL